MGDKGLDKTGLAYFWSELKTKFAALGHTHTASEVGAAPAAHASDTEKHITAAERTAWNNKLSSFTETDPTVPTWAKAASKPSYTAAEVGAAPASHVNDTTKHITAAERAAWNEKAGKPKRVQVTLTSSGWNATAKTQTVFVSGVSATEIAQMITPVPALASQAAYYDAGILVTGQAANSLTFTAKTVPTVSLTVYVVIHEVGAS